MLGGRGGYSDAGLGVLTVDFRGRGGEALQASDKVRLLDALGSRLESLPAVRSAGYAESLPDDPAGIAFSTAGDAESSRVAIRRVSPDLLEVLRIPVLRGRGLLNSDRPPGEPVGVVDRSFAERNDRGDPLDQWVAVGFDGARVVGIVRDIMTFPVEDRWRTMYRPYTGEDDPLVLAAGPGIGKVEVLVRFDGAASPERLAAVAEIPAAVDPAFRVIHAGTVRARRSGLLGSSVLASTILMVFGAAGLLLSVVGAVGHVVDTAVREAQSNAIRRALGAEPRSIVWRVIRRTAGAAGLGVGAGLLLGWVLTRAVGAAIPWVATADPLLFLGPAAFVCSLMLVISVAVTVVRVQRTDTWALIRSP